MRLNILIGGKAGQGINRVSHIVASILTNLGYFTFNYRDYQSMIRGGHNFNILSVSDKRVGSSESKVDGIVAHDDLTIKKHKSELKPGGFIIDYTDFENERRNLNISLAGALIKKLGINKEVLIKEIKRDFDDKAVRAAEHGYDSEKQKYKLGRLNNKIEIMSGSQAVAIGAVNSSIDIYFGYPMTPATGVLHELAALQKEKGHLVFQPENEIAAANSALGASFAGAKVMTGTSGGGFDLMTEALSLQGQTELPLTIYLASRPGPGTGVPTYTTQGDLDIALRGGHGEFPRVVIAPGDPIECIEKTNEAMYLSEKFNTLSIILSDKHLAESEFSSDRKPNKALQVKVQRKIPGEGIVRANSYEHDKFGNTTENAEITTKGAEGRIKKYQEIKKEINNKKLQMIKIYGNPKAANLIVGWGSTKTTILDALDSIDNSISTGKGKYKFLQVLYIKPLSDEIEKEIKKANKVLLVENNVTGQLGRLIREKTGISIPEKNRILRYDARPFLSDELKQEILKR